MSTARKRFIMFWSWRRLLALMHKEFLQLRRDRLTFAMMIGIPLMQMILFGFAINSDPRQLPTLVHAAEHNAQVRNLVSTLRASDYFDVRAVTDSLEETERQLRRGDVQFVLDIPAGFSRALARGEPAQLLLRADASDPAATSNALAALPKLLDDALQGPAEANSVISERLPSPRARIDLRVHRLYNPEARSAQNIVPGLMGVILTMTMIMMTALAITREYERGTMENLLAMPVTPIEVMLGKILPYIFIGYVQVGVILIAGHLLFAIPMLGSLPLLLACTLLFIIANLIVGITFSSLARSQAQAMQMSFFFFLPSILLSGFMFPFRGMPGWAQAIGEALPLTHFLRIVRGILLKGSTAADIAGEVLALLLFTVLTLLIGLRSYRRTLD